MQQIEETFEMKLSSKPSLCFDEILFAIYSEITPPEVFLNRTFFFSVLQYGFPLLFFRSGYVILQNKEYPTLLAVVCFTLTQTSKSMTSFWLYALNRLPTLAYQLGCFHKHLRCGLNNNFTLYVYICFPGGSTSRKLFKLWFPKECTI